MFQKEIEIKILDIDVSVIRKTLETHGCKFKGDNVQKYYVYNTKPFSSEIPALMLDLNNTHINPNYKQDIKTRLARKIIDLFSVIDKESANELLEFFRVKEIDTLYTSLFNDKYLETINISGLIEILKTHTYNPNEWIRLRQTGDVCTYAIKRIKRDTVPFVKNYNISGVDELEFEISDFATANFFLNQLGYSFKSYQEKQRISYVSEDGVSFEIDHWPEIPPYLEIEAKEENLINMWLKKLCLDDKEVKILNTDDVYKLYGLNIYDYKKLSFEQSEKYGVKLHQGNDI